MTECYYSSGMSYWSFASCAGHAKPSPDTSLIGIVDDDEPVREAVSSLLRSAGYRCALFQSAESFLDSPDLAETNCALLDVRMPGLSGLELQIRLRQLSQAIPIIFVTAHPDDAVRADALREGAIAFLRKPFSADALLAAVHDSLASSAINKLQSTIR